MPGQAKILTPSAEKRVFDYIALERPRTFKKDRVKLLLSWRAGLRAIEMAGLTWSSLCDAEGNLAGELTIHKHTTKGQTFTRVIPMHPELKVALRDLMPPRVKLSSRVLLNRSRNPLTPNALVVWFRKIYASANLDSCSSHSGRRGFLTRAARRCTEVGASMKDVQDLAGHASLSTTARYIDPNFEAKHALIRAI